MYYFTKTIKHHHNPYSTVPTTTTATSPSTIANLKPLQVKFTEEARRERQRRSEAGDQRCMLRYTPPAKASAPRPVSWTTAGAFGIGGWGLGKWEVIIRFVMSLVE